MGESFDNVVREYIDFVNRQVGVYMDALAGFAGHRTRVERQVHRMMRARDARSDENGQGVVVYVSYEDPSQPDIVHNRIIRASDYIAANSEDGSNAQQHSQAILVFLFTYWEDEIRPRLAASIGVEVNEVCSDIMGDLRIVRHAILHSKGILRPDKHKDLKKLGQMFAVDQRIHVSYDDMHRIVVFIKQDCARLLLKWLRVEDAPIQPDEVQDVAIQRRHLRNWPNRKMESIGQSLKSLLPNQQRKVYPPVGHCIYCGDTEKLTVEHVIPYGLGGRIQLPESSCRKCCKLTSDFEHTCLRTMYGPLRLLYDLPSRRKKKRPETLPLKVKRTPEEDWTYLNVEQEKYPFLVLFPFFSMPKMITGESECHGPATKRFWIRGASPSYVFHELLERLCIDLRVHSVMPEAKAQVREFSQMLAKIGYSFAVGELGIEAFKPFLIPHILRKELDDCDRFIGSLGEAEEATRELHEISIVRMGDKDLVVIRIRLLAKLETPTYYVVTGTYKK